MNRRGALGRADLVRLLAHADDGSELERRYAGLIGFERALPDETTVARHETSTEIVEGPADMLAVSIARRPLAPVSLLVPTSFRAVPQNTEPDGPSDLEPVDPGQKLAPGRPVRMPNLMSWPELERSLQTLVSVERSGPHIDMHRAIEGIARSEILSPLPRHRRDRLPSRLLVVRDLSEHLIPFWREQEIVRDAIRHRFPEIDVQDIVFHEAEGRFCFSDGDAWDEVDIAGSRDNLLVLGDLGALSSRAETLGRIWRRISATHRGARRSVLSPLAAAAMPTGLADRWQIAEWADQPTDPRRSIADRRRLADRLLEMIALPVSIEPGLLRLIRVLALPEADAAVESLAWTTYGFESRSSEALIRTGRIAPGHLSAFAALEPDVAGKLMGAMREWHGELAAEVWFSALLDLPEQFRGLDAHGDLERMDTYFEQLSSQIRRSGQGALNPALRDWLTQLGRLIDPAHKDRRVVSAIAAADRSFVPAHRPGTLEVPEESRLQGPITLRQQGADLVCSVGPDARGSMLGALWSNDGLIEVEPHDPFQMIWGENGRPGWVAKQGEDSYGPWASFMVGSVETLLRWIPPGQFLMGSPDEEPGRYDDESPRIEISHLNGFWLMDAPVTQALWDAVMGPKAESDHPNRFPDPERPVEMVSWDDAQTFLRHVNGLVPGLDLRLPSESEWEYACRAGTDTATYAGPMEILGDRNAPVLDEIAWYGGNSGVGFDLEDGYDSSSWEEKQYPHERAGTRKVRRRQPNGWGCHDMLGNVWEWCADVWLDTHEGADPQGGPRQASQQEDGGGPRVMRGGSWNDGARHVRSACRNRIAPVGRLGNVGFRCARGHASTGRSGEVRSGRAAEPRPGETELADILGHGLDGAALDELVEDALAQGPDATPSSRDGIGARCVHGRVNQGAAPIRLKLPGTAFTIRTDSAEVEITRWTRASIPWAENFGRDRFGVWSSFRVQDCETPLRWIPPGQFLMGSPDEEPGRYDDESPRIEISHLNGFWLMDAPVTQALWDAVMGAKAQSDHPNRFPDPERPVEMVSWDDAQTFLTHVNGLVPGLDLRLPSESEWEYACRAGTDTATYAGPMEILGDRNAPVLDEIAWYGGNSGVGFDLEDGYDSSEWQGEQHPHERAGTRKVKHRQPNAWGCHDMLGNVWEWCADVWSDTHEGADPLGGARQASQQEDGGGSRVMRGGSWFNGARYVRSACRYGIAPDGRSVHFGFRCARGHASTGRSGEVRSGRVAEPRPGVIARGPEGGAKGSVKQQEPLLKRLQKRLFGDHARDKETFE